MSNTAGKYIGTDQSEVLKGIEGDHFVRIDLYGRIGHPQRLGRETITPLHLWCAFLDPEQDLLCQSRGFEEYPESPTTTRAYKMDSPEQMLRVDMRDGIVAAHKSCVDSHVRTGFDRLGGRWCINPKRGQVVNLDVVSPDLRSAMNVLDTAMNGFVPERLRKKRRTEQTAQAREIAARLGQINPFSEDWFFAV